MCLPDCITCDTIQGTLSNLIYVSGTYIALLPSDYLSCYAVHAEFWTAAAQIDEAEEDQMASASPQQPHPPESAAVEADEDESDTERDQVSP